MIRHSPILNVDIENTDGGISKIHVKFLDQTEATYDSATDIDEIFRRVAQQQKTVEQRNMIDPRQGVDTHGTSA